MRLSRTPCHKNMLGKIYPKKTFLDVIMTNGLDLSPFKKNLILFLFLYFKVYCYSLDLKIFKIYSLRWPLPHGPVDSITCIGCGWMRKGWKFFKRSWFSSNLKMYYLWFQVVSTIVFTVGDVNEAPYDLHLTSSNAPIQFPEDKPKVKENAKGSWSSGFKLKCRYVSSSCHYW